MTERRLRRKHGRAPSWLTPFGGAFALEEGIECANDAKDVMGRERRGGGAEGPEGPCERSVERMEERDGR